MGASARFTFYSRALQVTLLAIAVIFSVGASTNSDSRLSSLNHKLMCQCGCSQLLGECDHVGCPSRDKELGELTADVSSGMSDQEVLDSFAGKYGAIVLAAPTTKGFDLVAWIAPFAVFAAALLDPAEQERLERIRRETGVDGGY